MTDLNASVQRVIAKSDTKLVQLKRKKGQLVNAYDIYIGRACYRGGWNLSQSDWHNPFKITECKNREDCLQRYFDYLKKKPELLSRLSELKGKIIGCFCKTGELCHGHVLLALILYLKV